MISKSDILKFKKIIYDISKAEKFPNSGLSDLEWQMKVNAKICDRSEERRVGKECRSRGAREHRKKKGEE